MSELLKIFTERTQNLNNPIEALIQSGLSYLEYATKFPEYFKIIYALDFSDLIDQDNTDERTIEKYRLTEGLLMNRVVVLLKIVKKEATFRKL